MEKGSIILPVNDKNSVKYLEDDYSLISHPSILGQGRKKKLKFDPFTAKQKSSIATWA